MHLLVEESIEIRCPVEQAYEYTCDLQNFAQWFPGVIQVVSQDTLDLAAPGKSYLETVALPLRGHSKVRIRVQEAQRSSIFITEGSLRPLLPRMEIRFDASGPGSTRVNWRMYSRNPSVLLRATLIPLARLVLKERARTGMANLKRRLESRTDA